MFKKLSSCRKKTAIALILLAFAISAVWFFVGNKEEEPQLQTATAQKSTIVSSITASGQVLTSNVDHASTKASGTVAKVYVADGEKVVKGQKLAEIELDTEGAQSYASAYSSYISAENSLKSAENSYRLAKATLEKVYDEIQGHDEDETFEMKETRTKAEVASDNAYDGLQTAQAKLSSVTLDYQASLPVIVAPASGMVSSVTIAEGMNLGATEGTSGNRASQRVASIVSEGTPIASFNVSEIDVSQIEIGQKVTITLDAIVDKTFTGKVVSVDRIGTTSNNVTTYPVIVKFDTSSNQILPNMAAAANIIIESKSNVLTVPSTAVQYQADQAYVKVSQGENEQTVLVEVGISSDTQTEIVSGLDEGDVIVTGTITTSEQPSQNQGGGGGFFPIGGGGPR